MNDRVMSGVAKSLGLPEVEPPEKPSAAPKPVLAAFVGPLPSSPPRSKSVSLDEAFGALPMRFIRAAREAARQSNSVEQWAAVESAHDAIVSARE